MITQQRSQTFKPGEPLDHIMAVEKVYEFLEHNRNEKWFIDVNVPVVYPSEINKQLPKNRTFGGHTFDLGVYAPVFVEDTDNDIKYIREFRLKAVIEINGNVGYKYETPHGIKRANPTKHSKELQKRNDKINKNYCKNEGIKYIVLLKEEIMGDIKDKDKEKNTIQYMQRNLLEFIK
jgi:hypothetical protein